MDAYMVIFRVLHIFSGIIWVGFAAFMVFVALPVYKRIGADGAPFMLGLFNKSRFGSVIVATSLITTVAGLALYDRVSDHFNSDYMSSDQGIVLSIGALAGLLAFGHGFALIKYIRQTTTLANEVSGTPTSEQQNQLDFLVSKLSVNANISFGLMVIAVIGMSAARYV